MSSPIHLWFPEVFLSLAATPKSLTSGLQTIQYMQDTTSTLCTTTPDKTAITLTDSRDGNTYSVTKLDDGKCWMTQNLKLVNKTITSADSDVTSSFIVKPSTEPSEWDNETDCVYYDSSTVSSAYYTWYAATAGTSDSNDATKSICPKGWRLPTKVEYENLLSKAGIGSNSAGVTKLMGNPYSFGMAGWIYFHSDKYESGNYLGDVGSGGYYWSSTAYGSDRAYGLSFGSSSVRTSYDDRTNGFSIRCIAK